MLYDAFKVKIYIYLFNKTIQKQLTFYKQEM